MNIDEIYQAKQEMEEKISAAVHAAMTVFHEQTSLSPNAIYIGLVEVSNLGERRYYALGTVNCTVEI